MTIARDIRTGAVVGQVTRRAATDHIIEHDAWMTTPGDKDYLAPGDRWCRVCAKLDSEHDAYRLLTRDGRYVTVPASSVRLEELR